MLSSLSLMHLSKEIWKKVNKSLKAAICLFALRLIRFSWNWKNVYLGSFVTLSGKWHSILINVNKNRNEVLDFLFKSVLSCHFECKKISKVADSFTFSFLRRRDDLVVLVIQFPLINKISFQNIDILF